MSPHSEKPAAAGCVLGLLPTSESMRQALSDAPAVTKLQAAQWVLDFVLDALVATAGRRSGALDVAVIGYHLGEEGAPEFLPLLPGTSPQQVWVSVAELAALPPSPRRQGPRHWCAVEPSGAPAGNTIVPHAYQLVQNWLRVHPDASAPLVLLCADGPFPDDSAARSLRALSASGGNTVLFPCFFREDAPTAIGDGRAALGNEHAAIGGPRTSTLGPSSPEDRRAFAVTSLSPGSLSRSLRRLIAPAPRDLPAPEETSPREIPSLHLVKVFKTAKLGNAESEWEDAFHIDLDNGRFAVSDGAGEGIFVKLWAGLLARGFVEDRPDLADPEALRPWLAACRARWKQEINYRGLRWAQQVKVDRVGGGATFLGLEIRAEDGAGGWRWKAWAMGDACMFVVRDGHVQASFPVIDSRDFGFAPALLRTLTDMEVPAPSVASGTCSAGDVLALATDAVAQQLMRGTERGEAIDWEGYWDLDEPSWIERINRLRAEGAIVNDDCTLLLIKLGGGSVSPDAADTPAVL